MSPGVGAAQRWSRAGFVFAAIGAAVGLGNIWRFPYLAGQSGGGAFLIPYFVGVFLLALPVMLGEIAVGRLYRESVLGALGRLSPCARLAGLLVLLLVVLLMSYYMVVVGWTLGYALLTPIGASPEFGAFTSGPVPLACFAAVALVAWLIIRLGVKRGIERACTVMLPLLFVFLAALVVAGLGMPGLQPALQFYLSPDWGSLAEPGVWAAGFGQAFYSLSAGMGIMLTYGAYLPRRQHVAASAVVVVLADTSIALLAGLAIFPAVFSMGMSPAAGPQLAFVTLPAVFAGLPLGTLLGTLFFVALFLAGITSVISAVEVVVSELTVQRAWRRGRATVATVGLMAAVGVPSALSYAGFDLRVGGVPLLDFMDNFVGTVLIPATAIGLSLVLGWLLAPEKLAGELGREDRPARLGVARALSFLLRGPVPIALFLVAVSEVVG